MIMQQQRVVFCRSTCKIPDRFLQECVILRVDAGLLIIQKGHARFRLLKLFDLAFGQFQTLCDIFQFAGFAQQFPHLGSPVKIVLCTGIGVIVVVDTAGILIRTGDAVEMETAVCPAAEVDPESRRFKQDLRALFSHKVQIARQQIIVDHCKRNIAIKVVLCRTGRIIARTFLAGDGAPCKQRAFFVAKNLGVRTGFGQNLVTIGQQVFRLLPVGQRKEGQFIHLGIPEIVTLIPFARQTFRGNVRASIPAGRLKQLVQREPD